MRNKGKLLLAVALMIALVMTACAPEPETDPSLESPVEVPEEEIPRGSALDEPEAVGDYEDFYDELPIDDNLTWYIRKF